MSKIGKDLLQGMENAIRYVEGKKEGARKHVVRVPKSVNIKAIRHRLHLTQEGFANEFGFALSTVKDWEQGRRTPERATRILLKIIERDPKIVERVLAS